MAKRASWQAPAGGRRLARRPIAGAPGRQRNRNTWGPAGREATRFGGRCTVRRRVRRARARAPAAPVAGGGGPRRRPRPRGAGAGSIPGDRCRRALNIPEWGRVYGPRTIKSAARRRADGGKKPWRQIRRVRRSTRSRSGSSGLVCSPPRFPVAPPVPPFPHRVRRSPDRGAAAVAVGSSRLPCLPRWPVWPSGWPCAREPLDLLLRPPGLPALRRPRRHRRLARMRLWLSRRRQSEKRGSRRRGRLLPRGRQQLSNQRPAAR
jgi:hypothetical protein